MLRCFVMFGYDAVSVIDGEESICHHNLEDSEKRISQRTLALSLTHTLEHRRLGWDGQVTCLRKRMYKCKISVLETRTKY